MEYNYKGIYVDNPAELLNAFREGNMCPVYAKRNMGGLFEYFESVIESESELDMYAYAWVLLKHGDFAQKHKGYSIAYKLTEKGFAPAYNLCGLEYFTGNLMEKNCAEGIRLIQKSSDGGFIIGKYNLGCAYIKGEGVEKDSQKGFKILEECAEYGYNSAIRSLGLRYYRGKDGCEVNYGLAKKYFEAAAEQYDTKSMVYLGEIYASGLGVPVDFKNAVDWYKKAAELDNFDAQAILGVLLIDETKGEKQPEQAYSYMKESAENGIVASMYNIAVCILNGEFWWETKETAKYWLEKAASAGDEDAKKLLETFE